MVCWLSVLVVSACAAADWARAQDRKDMDNTPKEPGLCEDYMEECKDWAERGECEANKQFMVSSLLPAAAG